MVSLSFFPSIPETVSNRLKFLNTIGQRTVFMNEGGIVVAGVAILSGATRRDGKAEPRPMDHADGVEDLVRAHSRLVYRIAYAVLRSHDDAEDAVQETFVRILRFRARLATVHDPKMWLARIAWRVAMDCSKQRGRTRETPLQSPGKPGIDVASAEATADDTLHGARVGAVLEKLIAALPEKLRQPLILSTIEEMSPCEVAATLGLSEAAVRSRVFRARQILHEKLAERLGRK